MTDVSITEANMLEGSGNKTILPRQVAGAALTRSQIVYKDTANSNVWKPAQCDGTALEAGSAGIGYAAQDVGSGQYVDIVTFDDDWTPGGTLAIGTEYVVSATAGGIAPSGDLMSTNYHTHLGTPKSTSKMVFDPSYTGAVVA